MLQRAVPALEGTYSSDNRYEAYANYNLGYTLLQLGRCAEALPYLDRSEDLQGFRTEIADARAAAEDCLGEDASSGSPRGSGSEEGERQGQGKGQRQGRRGLDGFDVNVGRLARRQDALELEQPEVAADDRHGNVVNEDLAEPAFDRPACA